jgi:hypothetical protein
MHGKIAGAGQRQSGNSRYREKEGQALKHRSIAAAYAGAGPWNFAQASQSWPGQPQNMRASSFSILNGWPSLPIRATLDVELFGSSGNAEDFCRGSNGILSTILRHFFFFGLPGDGSKNSGTSS